MKYLLSISVLFWSFQVFAQAENDDLKVGLVLSGGGAKGLAHIGVLKVIEEAGIKLDYIAGTSMGAVVGGLYAAGYSASQLDSIFTSVNFDNIIQDNLPREAKTFYERADAERYAIKLPFDNFKVSLPSSLSKGQNTYNLLSRTLEHVSDIENYSKLPIPFFCIATDVEKGEQVILDSGYLPESISASGALPSLFSPVLLDGKLLIDGGVVNNYPIYELRDKGMDIIIGVDVQDTLRGRKDLKSATDVLLQINNYKTIQDMVTKRGETDIYIRPSVDDFSVVSFDMGREIVSKGSKMAMDQYEILKELAIKQNATVKKKIAPITTDSIAIQAVTISGNDHYTRSYILGKLKFKPPLTLKYETLYEGFNNLSATENFKRVGHKLQAVEDGYLLHIALQEATSTQSLKLGIQYNDLYRASGLLNFTKKRVLFRNDVASMDLIVGDNIRYNFDYYIDKGFYWSVGLNSSYTSFNHSINAQLVEEVQGIDIAGVNKLSLDYQDLTNKIYLQTLFLKQFSLDLGLKHKYLDVETETLVSTNEGDQGVIFEKSHLAGAYGQLKYDSLDNIFFPNSGFYFDGDFNLYVYSSDFNNSFSEFGIANAEFKYAQNFKHNLTAILEISGGFKVGGKDTRTLDFFLGGYGAKKVNNMVPFLGYDFFSVTGDGYVKAAFELDYEIFKKNHVNLSANFANVGYDLFESPDDWLPPPSYSGYSLGYGAETFMGPMEVKYTYSPEIKASEWFISLGFRF
ncbi:patatin-like phospholipase family protein [Dokdonia sp. Hel_I_53]|uniref:patatin-like phospholipase family protein n=1 Tax=Dokdonia sp. Hel_I_53 TaxID=1566287 RepID=UPI001198E3E1|nr:patatin-like phospholipase family protein [Dokdonia sp. Hel_I_53]TVZ52600.1 NTE family protein [Dokdonia sp. Hel_I_53]